MSNGSPPLVGLYTSAPPVFRSRARGCDWNLVDSIGLELQVSTWVRTALGVVWVDNKGAELS